MNPPSLWERLRSARIVQVLLVYLGASWVVLQLAETLGGLLELPEWVGPVAVILLAIGLVVVLATAWVQSLPQTSAKEEAGEVPTDWEVAPADAVKSLMSGKLPHLTWARAILGGVVALSLLFGAGGLYVMVKGPTSLLGPAEAGAEGVASGIAVLPFHVTGPSLDLYREGMVDLVSANLDGLSGYRSIDARTVLARWNRDVGEGADAGLDDALRVAAGTGARYAVVGSGVEVGSQIRFTADIYDLDTGEKVGDGQVEGTPEEVLALVDALTVNVMRSLLEATGQASTAQDFRLASMLTVSVPALRAYLEGDAAFRRGHFEEAREHLERAVQEDSTFALAHWRLGEAIGWTEGIGAGENARHKNIAARYVDRLPPREATLLEVGAAISDGEGMSRLPELNAHLRRYPDDPDGWYLLGEVGLHDDGPPGVTDRRLEEALYEAVELDPTFGPYYIHALNWASSQNQPQRFDSLMSGWLQTDPDPRRVEVMELRRDLILGDEETRAAAAEQFPELTDVELRRLGEGFRNEADALLPRLEPYLEELIRRNGWDRDFLRSFYMEQGRFAEARGFLADGTDFFDVVGRALWVGDLYADWGVGSPADVRAALDELRSLEAEDPRQEYRLAREMASLASLLGDEDAFDAARAAAVSAYPSILPESFADTTTWVANQDATLGAYWLAHNGQGDEAWELVEAAPDFEGESPSAGFVESAADIAFHAERWREMIPLYEGVSRHGHIRALAKYRLGRAYEETGDAEMAVEAYRAFLARFQYADPGIAPVEEARAALERLEG